MVVSTQDFAMRIGQTKVVNFTLTDEETGLPFQLGGAIVYWKLLEHSRSDTPILDYNSNVTGVQIISPTAGTVRITIPAVDSAELGQRTYYHALWVEVPGACTPASEGTVTVTGAGTPCT